MSGLLGGPHANVGPANGGKDGAAPVHNVPPERRADDKKSKRWRRSWRSREFFNPAPGAKQVLHVKARRRLEASAARKQRQDARRFGWGESI
jgi:hypothetical protein